jgi:hypothetical protein
LGEAMDSHTLPNHEIVTLAVFLLGGESQYVDTEDVAVRANELAPGRFTWRKYPGQINLELIRVYLSDAKKPGKGVYLLGSGNTGWMLTEHGLGFARKAIASLDVSNLSSVALKPRDRRWRDAQRVRMLTSAAFAKSSTGQEDLVSAKEAAEFFRIDDYVFGQARERRLVRFLNAFGDDPALGEIVRQLAHRLREEGTES